VGPAGITKSRTALLVEPEFVTDAGVPLATVVVVPISTVADVPGVPVPPPVVLPAAGMVYLYLAIY
jgi:hypothetical protein